MTANAGTAFIPPHYDKNKVTQIIGKKPIPIKKAKEQTKNYN
jgi:hypothetical protein